MARHETEDDVAVPAPGKASDNRTETERMAELGQAVATVTHELRNPLAAMRTWLHVLEQKLPSGDPELRRPFERIKRGIRQCDRIIDDLLDYARGAELKPQPTQIDRWLRGVIQEQFLPDGVAAAFRPGLAGHSIPIDRDRLRRAVVNLVENACQAIKYAGEPGTLTVSTLPVGPDVVLRVADTGPGVPEDIREQIFEPLFSTKASGVGLGLAIVRDIVEQHGGTIRLEDSVDGGACFSILLPADGRSPDT